MIWEYNYIVAGATSYRGKLKVHSNQLHTISSDDIMKIVSDNTWSRIHRECASLPHAINNSIVEVINERS